MKRLLCRLGELRRGHNHESSDWFEYPPSHAPPEKKPYSNPANQKRKILAKLSNLQKSRNRKFQTPQNWSPSIRARHLYSEVLPPPTAARLAARSLSVWDGKALFNAWKAWRFPMFCCPRFLFILVKIWYSSDTVNKIWNFDLIEILWLTNVNEIWILPVYTDYRLYITLRCPNIRSSPEIIFKFPKMLPIQIIFLKRLPFLHSHFFKIL